MTRPTAAGLLSVGLLVGCSKGPAPPSSMQPTPSLAGAFEYEGVNHVSWWFDEYEGSAGSDSRQALVATGANWAGVLLTWYMPSRDSSVILPDARRTPSDEAVVEAIRQLHAAGLRVMLKPHVDVDDGTWRGSIRPPDATAWFESYATYLQTVARLAQAEQAEMLCVGTELARLSGSEFRGRWLGVIATIRAEYSGQLTYAANAVAPGDEFSGVAFWDALDLAGLDAYVPLTNRNDPTREELVAAWSRNRNGDDMLSAFRNWQRGHGKPVLFTEIGYRSADGANQAPWEWGTSPPYDAEEQADCYYAAFAVWLQERQWLKGLFWWSWDVPVPAAGDTGYTPRNKPAGALLTERYSAP